MGSEMCIRDSISTLVGIIILILLIVTIPFGFTFATVWSISSSALLFKALADRRPHSQFKTDSYKTARIIYLVAAIVSVPLLIVFNNLSFIADIDMKEQPDPNHQFVPIDDASWFNLLEEADTPDAGKNTDDIDLNFVPTPDLELSLIHISEPTRPY